MSNRGIGKKICLMQRPRVHGLVKPVPWAKSKLRVLKGSRSDAATPLCLFQNQSQYALAMEFSSFRQDGACEQYWLRASWITVKASACRRFSLFRVFF